MRLVQQTSQPQGETQSHSSRERLSRRSSRRVALNCRICFNAFNSQHPERKKYAHRCKFDWVQYSETKEHRNVVRLGYRAPLLTKEQAVTFWTTEKQMARMAALKRWESELSAAVVKQYDGPNGEVQIPVRVEATLSAVQLGCSNSRLAGPEKNMTS